MGYDEETPGATTRTSSPSARRPARTWCPSRTRAGEAETAATPTRCWEHGWATIGLTTTTFSFSNGIILDADIELNASQPGGDLGFLFTTVSSPLCEGLPSPECVATDLQNT